jgi:hypothetical protein
VVSEPQDIRVGETVMVPWGFDEQLGRVIRTYTTGLGKRVTVQLLGDDLESETVTVPADSVYRVPASPPGVETPDPFRYERALLASLKSISPEGQLTAGAETGDRGYDIRLDLADRTVLVEAKVRKGARGVTSDDVTAVSGLSRHWPVLLVSNSEPTPDAQRRLRALRSHGHELRVVKWSGPEDNAKLAMALHDLLIS